MPAFAHVIISLGISLLLNKATEGKFTPRHALVFVVNSFFGPDLMGFLPYTGYYYWEVNKNLIFKFPAIYWFFHGYGWPIIALVLIIPWDLFLNRTTWDKKEKKLKFLDPEKERYMSVRQLYFLIVAGGIFHQFVDIIGHPSYITLEDKENFPWGAVWMGGDTWITIKDIWGTGMFPCGNYFGFIETWIFYGVIGLIIILILFKYSHKSDKTLMKSFVIVTIIYMAPLILFYFIPDYSGFNINSPGVNYYGDPNYIPSTYRLIGGEADLGVLIFFFLFLFVPLLLLYYSFNELSSSKDKESSEPLGNSKEELYLLKNQLEESKKRIIELELEIKKYTDQV
ncbi:MAG: hypothetical protein ACTSR8_17780 [Promethearchaeota archaeon]